jgi:hypothetical protein
VADAPANRLEGGPAVAELGGVPADGFGEMMIDGAEEPAPAVALGIEARGVGPPHLVGPLRDDGAVVSRIAVRGAQPARCQQDMNAHEPQHALAPEVQPAVGQAGPHFAIALAMEWARGQDRPFFR